MTYDNGKDFSGHSLIDRELNSTAYFARPFAVGSEAVMRTLMGCFANTFQRSEPFLRSVMRNKNNSKQIK